MLIDTNAYLGAYAFRQLRHNTPGALLSLMDAKGIDKAMVSNPLAITYRNTQPANEELAAAVKPHRDRLVPLAVINPFYAGWEDDLRVCREELGMRGLRLYPKWHNYALTDSCCRELVAAAAERAMFVSISVRVEDPRQRSWLVDVPDVPLADIAALVKACPKTNFVILEGAGYTASELGRKGNSLPANYLIEISRLSALLANEIGQLIANIGADRLVFGSGMPFKYPDPALVKLEVVGASQADLEKIRHENAARLIGG